ncbi:hypothetical protein OFO12_07140 [Campylobacter sp. JMF_04 NA10]|uniref:hypothetical protein n=1 Tax=Campylobacter sp. JMF_04 NA10 TaxID=2983824 RepID=UPI0022E99A55|nr:hypothetical protein [Campylobacter sp. JMF_04 NA10]MDA3077130.1 hypothetical protein [Campylobacter sp. JMF_04 NA10]
MKKFIKIFAVLFLIFFGDLIIISVVFHYYGYKKAKINIYEKSQINSYYMGEAKINEEFNPIRFPLLGSNAVWLELNDYDINFENLVVSKNVDYIDYKEINDLNQTTNGKYFRIYLADENSQNCFLSAKSVKPKFQNLFNKNCVARKEIYVSELSKIEFKQCYNFGYQKNNICVEQPNIQTNFIENFFNIKYYYTGFFKDRNSNKILANSVYIYQNFHSWLGEIVIKVFGEEQRSSSVFCNSNNTTDFNQCNQELINIFFKKVYLQ